MPVIIKVIVFNHFVVLVTSLFYLFIQIAPAEIEAKILQHPDVVDVAVVGVPHEQAGEIPKAFVVKKPTSLLTEQDVKDFILGKLMA